MITSKNSVMGMAALAVALGISSLLLGATSSTPLKRTGMSQLSRNPQERIDRIQRIKQMSVDQAKLAAFITQFRTVSRQQLTAEGYLVTELPHKGTAVLSSHHRTDQGNRLLVDAKDLLFALLFGDETTAVRFNRVERELLSLTVPCAKAHVLAFMKASTELAGAGTWQDPEDLAHDERADNVIIEVEYGEIREELIGDGIITTLRLINLLEVNEQVMYARMTNIEQSTLVE